MLIYIFHVIVSGEPGDRKELYSFIVDKFPNQQLEGEDEAFVEEVMLDLFENEYLVEYDGLRNEFQQYKQSVRNAIIIEEKSLHGKKSVFKGSIKSLKHRAEGETEYCGITESISPSVQEEL
jgi:hypothetical protein